VPRGAGVAAEVDVTRIGLSQILSSLRHRKGAYTSLVLEVALGCTVVAYMFGLGRGLTDIAQRSLGYDDERTFLIAFEQPLAAGFAQRIAAERAQLNALPGVEVAAWAEVPPMSRRELPVSVQTPEGAAAAWSLRGDPQLVAALGLSVTAGRVLNESDAASKAGKAVLVTRGLESTLGLQPLGAELSSPELGRLTVVGLIDEELRLSPFLGGKNRLLLSVTAPNEARRSEYVVRTRAEHAAEFARVARQRLRAAAPERHVTVERVSEVRLEHERSVGGANTIIAITVFGMVLVVLVGSLGMASSLVVERTRQIGIRRALGARRADIVGQFMLESLLATLLGIAVSAGMCAVLDLALAEAKGNLVIQWYAYLPLAAALFLISGQVAALIPALRAASIEPSVVSRAA
jgi:putative ABC transport system permease protein